MNKTPEHLEPCPRSNIGKGPPAIKLRKQVEMLKAMEIDKAKRDLLIRSLDTVIQEGEELSEKLGGALGFRGAKLSIDLTVAIGKGRISKAEQEAAQRNLDTMREQHRRARQRISELDGDLAERCRDRLQAHQ